MKEITGVTRLPFFDVDDQKTFVTSVPYYKCYPVPAEKKHYDTIISEAYGTKFYRLSACIKSVLHVLFYSKLAFPKLRRIDVHHGCVCSVVRPFILDVFSCERLPLLHYANLFIPHRLDRLSNSANLYYALQRNKEAISRTVFTYLSLRQFLVKDVVKLICRLVLNQPRDEPCQEEKDIAKTWLVRVKEELPKTKVLCAEDEKEMERMETKLEEYKYRKEQLVVRVKKNRKVIDNMVKMVDFVEHVMKKQKR
jgi:hypothetical protein